MNRTDTDMAQKHWFANNKQNKIKKSNASPNRKPIVNTCSSEGLVNPAPLEVHSRVTHSYYLVNNQCRQGTLKIVLFPCLYLVSEFRNDFKLPYVSVLSQKWNIGLLNNTNFLSGDYSNDFLLMLDCMGKW